MSVRKHFVRVACTLALAPLLAGCPSGHGGLGGGRSGPQISAKESTDYSESVLRVAGSITGSILVMPIQKDLDVDYGFGLYTTILLTRANPTRNLEFIRALEKVPQHTVDSLKRAERVQKNAFFMPSDISALGHCITSLGLPAKTDTNAAVFYLSKDTASRHDFHHLVYSYEIAEQWLSQLRNKRFNLGNGPILITSPAPISKMGRKEAFLIVTDLSSTSEKLFRSYVDVLVDEIKKPSTWRKQEVDSLALKLAHQVAVFDQAMKNSLQSFGGLVQVAEASARADVPSPSVSGLPAPVVASCNRLRPFFPT